MRVIASASFGSFLRASRKLFMAFLYWRASTCFTPCRTFALSASAGDGRKESRSDTTARRIRSRRFTKVCPFGRREAGVSLHASIPDLAHSLRRLPEQESRPQDRLPVKVEIALRAQVLDHVPVDRRVVLPSRFGIRT